MSSMYEIIGRSDPTYLLADPNGADVIAIPLKPGQGTIKRGTLVYRAANGMYVKATTSELTTSYFLAVLDVTVNTDADDNVAEDARAYRAGRFIYGKVFVGDSANLASYLIPLRMQGIVFDRMDDGVEFENGNYRITYVANNDVTPAEDDVVLPKEPNVTYTVLNNSDSKLGFTAPATKSFSKWNTKADGSGVDYAAAASYTANADLTLYAIWA